jgi:hypothetical protein
VAVPTSVIASPVFLVHGFYQLLLGAVLVYLAARWQHGRATALRRTLAGVALAVLFVQLAGPLLVRLVTYPTGIPLDDPQGAIRFLPGFQVGLYLALWVAAFAGIGWRRFLIGLAALGLTQAAGVLALHALTTYSGFPAPVRHVRGWAVAGPLVIIAALVKTRRTRQ